MYVIPPDTTYRMYSAVNGFLPVELLVAVEGPTGCGEVVMVGRLFSWNFSVTRRQTEGLDQTRRCRCISFSLLVYRSKIPPAKNHALHYTSTFNSWQ